MLNDDILNGLGAGGPLGILQSGAYIQVAKETGQDADDQARDHPQREHGEDEGVERDGEAAGELAEGLHQNGSPSVYQMLFGRATRKKVSNTKYSSAGIAIAEAATQCHR